MKCPSIHGCPGTISVLENEDGVFYYPCTECKGVYKKGKKNMPELRNNVPCPTPGCQGSRCDIIITDDNGNWVGQRSEPCNVCYR